MPRSLWVFRVDRDTPFIMSELFSNNKLRQGWGIPDLDLHLNEATWVTNYINGGRTYWNEQISPDNATECRNLLIPMLNMRIRDVIFLPNVGKGRIDEELFTLVTVKDIYHFEDMRNQPIIDYGHVIPVNNFKTYAFSNQTLTRGIFGPPYLRRVVQVQPHFQSFQELQNFLIKVSY